MEECLSELSCDAGMTDIVCLPRLMSDKPGQLNFVRVTLILVKKQRRNI